MTHIWFSYKSLRKGWKPSQKTHERQTPHNGDIQMINKHMKRWSTFLIIVEIKLEIFSMKLLREGQILLHIVQWNLGRKDLTMCPIRKQDLKLTKALGENFKHTMKEKNCSSHCESWIVDTCSIWEQHQLYLYLV